MNKNKIKNIAIIRLSSLGDIIHTLPAFSLLRREFPEARIKWIVEPLGAKLLRSFYGIDEIIVLAVKQKSCGAKLKEIKRIRSHYKGTFDLIFDFQGLLKSAFLAKLLQGYVLGFAKVNLREPQARFFYHEMAGDFPEQNHVIYKNIHLVKGYMSKPEADHIQYPLKEIEESDAFKEFFKTYKVVRGKYLIINVGGGWDTKILRKNQFLDLINRLKYKYQVFLLWGNRQEESLASVLSQETGVIKTPLFNFNELILFIKNSRLIITADTLALHIADMVKVPSVGIFGPSSPYRNGSLLPASVAIFANVGCRFCYKKKCDTIDCIKNIETERIVLGIESIDEKYS